MYILQNYSLYDSQWGLSILRGKLKFVHFSNYRDTPILHITRFELTRFPLPRYPEDLSSDSTNANFEVNPPLECKNPLSTDTLIGQPIGQPYFIEGT